MFFKIQVWNRMNIKSIEHLHNNSLSFQYLASISFLFKAKNFIKIFKNYFF